MHKSQCTMYHNQNSPDFGQKVEKRNAHVRFVVGTNFLDPDVVLGVHKRFCGTVGLSDGDHTGNVLKVTQIVHFDLQREKRRIASVT